MKPFDTFQPAAVKGRTSWVISVMFAAASALKSDAGGELIGNTVAEGSDHSKGTSNGMP